MKSMKPIGEKIIIIGNGAAGTSACAEIRARKPEAEIELISEENVIGYNRPMLTKGILAKVDNPNFNIKPNEWYVENNVKLLLGVTVTDIDHRNKSLTLSNGDVLSFDKLILATGAKSNVPKIKGSDFGGVFSIRTIKDIVGVSEFLKNIEKAVVVGGGLLGLETAWEIRKAEKEVTVVQNS
ncbi:MAG TPA: FAD-dependent oxidoreductase, partial [Anaerovoracaceae bacterium]|nr:FAD-dependent oxidoreductase [Anaerovoracaceae bacterium]